MALNIIQGSPGAGKSYIAVNEFMRQWLENSVRPIYTNLPLCKDKDGVFEIVKGLTKNAAKRDTYQSRVHLLVDGFVDCGEWMNPETGVVEKLGARHGTREFWYFTKPNSVIFLDELAEIYDAKDRSSQPETFATYCRLHRHYKDDFYGFAQDRRDVLAQFRRLVQYVWTVRNSTKENIFGWWALRGIKWPFQFFICKCYLAAQVMESATFEKSHEPMESFNCWPKKKGFGNYESFSKVGAMGWKESAAETDGSSDVNQGWWLKTAGFIRQSGVLIAMAGAALVAAYMGYRAFQFLLHPPTDLVGSKSGATPVSLESAKPELAMAGSLSSPKSISPIRGETNSVLRGPAIERLVLVSPGRLKTNQREIYVGDEIAGRGVVLGVYMDGIRTDKSGGIPWRVLFQGGGLDGGGRSGGDVDSLRGVDSGSGGKIEGSDHGATNHHESIAGARSLGVSGGDKVP